MSVRKYIQKNGRHRLVCRVNACKLTHRDENGDNEDVSVQA
jgi:hypothetical protein